MNRRFSLLVSVELLLVSPMVMAGPPPHAEAARKKGIEATINVRTEGVFDLAWAKVIDLTHPISDDEVSWSRGRGHSEEEDDSGERRGVPVSSVVGSSTSCLEDHHGTHVDAPALIMSDGKTIDEYPLERLMGPLVVFDISEKVKANPAYRFSKEDFARMEPEFGDRIPKGAFVFVRTGWSDKWGEDEYFGGDGGYPTIDPAVARTIIKGRKIAALGIDSPNVEPPGERSPTHRVAAGEEVLILENLAHLDHLGGEDAWIIALPVKVEGATASSIRVIAIVKQDRPQPNEVDD